MDVRSRRMLALPNPAPVPHIAADRLGRSQDIGARWGVVASALQNEACLCQGPVFGRVRAGVGRVGVALVLGPGVT